MSTVEQFFAAVKEGDLEKVRAMVQQDASLALARDNNGVSGIIIATYHRRGEVAELLIQQRAAGKTNGSANPANQLDIFEAAATGRAERVIDLAVQDPNALKSFSSDGWTPLHLACAFNHPETVKSILVLLDPEDVHLRSKNALQNQAIHAAAALGRSVAIVLLLLQRGADANARQHGGFTPLHAAAFNGDLLMAKTLLAHGARADVQSEDSQTPLDLALTRGHQSLVALFESKDPGEEKVQ